MRITILGATGRTGRHLVEQGLDDGHRIIAFARNPERIEVEHPHLTTVAGKIEDHGPLEEAVRDADCVISAIGLTKTSNKDVLRRTAENVTHAMDAHGVRRLVSLIGAGVQQPGDHPTIGRRLMRGVMKIAARGLLDDAEGHAETIRRSNTDWTLVRPPRLTDGQRTSSYRIGYLGLGPMDTISRADLAEFMLRIATEGGYESEAPMVAY